MMLKPRYSRALWSPLLDLNIYATHSPLNQCETYDILAYKLSTMTNMDHNQPGHELWFQKEFWGGSGNTTKNIND